MEQNRKLRPYSRLSSTVKLCLLTHTIDDNSLSQALFPRRKGNEDGDDDDDP